MTRSNALKYTQQDEEAEIEMIRARERARRLREARALADRMQVLPDGSRVFVRFMPRQRLQHQILIGSFTALGLTGLLQSFSRVVLISWIINSLLGGIETLRTIHHLAAIIFGLQAFFHAGEILYLWTVKRERGSMWPAWSDLTGLIGMIKFNLNRAKERPLFDRFSIEEKVEYWAMLWGTVIMGITGLFQWLPLFITSILPGITVPIARTIHAWEAILAVLSILIWHVYHTVIKENNQSIFTGVMTEEEMQELHTLEYRRILAAVEFVHKASLPRQKESKQKQSVEAANEVAEIGTTD
ncbi:MAG: hypothetical protein AB1649_06345 [Chloroflexota bacterium]